MGKGRPRAVEKGVLGQHLSVASSGSLNIPSGPVFYPSEDEFRDPLEYIYKIRVEAEPYGICRIVPPKSWKPPFALDLDSFTFPTKTQAIHQLQARPASCDSQTFELEYNRFLEDHCGKKSKKRVVFEGEELDLCKLFNAVKRYGGYDHVVKEKKWGEVSRFVSSEKKISECAKHVLCQLYCEHLCDYEDYYKQLNKEAKKGCKRGLHDERKCGQMVEHLRSKKRQKTKDGEKGKVCKYKVKEEHDQICEQCKSGLHGEVMLLCDRCNKGWHTYCLSPPLKQVPPGNWYCLDCLNSDKDSFGFVPGKQFSLEAFRRMADRARKKWFGSGSSSREQIEKKFWEIVEGSLGEVEVMYGSDLDTSVYGSGFPHARAQKPESIDAKEWDEYRCSPWNLNNLPKLKGSVLRAVHHNITGVMVPWLYIGMLFSSFCWHFEDHCFYSMNYLHWGEPKCWYSVPGSEATAFEKVMKKSLPDLFDAQPDLLFQLVTMLNPSVLRENGVPVYSVLQEPGNFVITFPRSYHGGFNLGLNCAEAVNFAPADWIPHGGFGAELYQLYRKIAVLSHEELLCVVAKNDCDERVSPYLKKELLRIYAKEKSWRQRLWKNGIVRSSSMAPRKCPEYVGTEEDPKCIICQQYLYLSAVVCRCRRSAFVCLEHWERLCECKYSKRRLLYRHTLSELYDLVLTVNEYGCDETMQSLEMQQPISCFSEANALTRKVKDDHVTFAELSAQWLLNSSKILQNPFSNDAYVKALKEVEQFLWAGSEMDPVRDMAGKLIETKKWMVGIKDCIVKVENFQGHPGGNVEKIHLDYVINLLSLNHSPCNELTYLKLMAYTEEARLLIQEIDTALSTSSNVSEWEALHSKACALPIYIQQIEKLEQQISLVKVCKESIRVIIENGNEVEVDILYKLKSQVMELHVKLPETEMLFDLISQAESHRSKCAEIIKGPITLKIVEEFLQELSSFNVSLPELKLLRQHHMDAVSWIARFNNIMVEIHEREDQHNVIDELNCILRDGSSLAIQVDELARVEDELKKAYCREKAQKWKQHCLEIVANSVGEKNSLLGALQEIKQTVDRSLSIYDKSLDGERNLNACCSTSSLDQKLHNCSICKQGYHIGCLQLSVIDTNDADLFTCPYCQCIISSSVTQKISLLKCRGNLPKLEELIKLKCDAEDFSDCIEEGDTLTKLVEQALVCRSRLTEISDLASHNTNKDLTIVFQRLTVALKAIEVSGVSDYRSNNALERAVVRNSWRFRVNKILEGQEKPTIQQIQKLLKEGLAINISLEDCFRTKLLDMKNVSSKWADRTKKISADSGALALEKVFEYIAEGESLPVNVEKELKLLRTRSMLYCICRKPYDQRAMIACDQCDEWYHFDCIKLHSTPKTYICPACKPQTDDKSCSLPVSIKYESSINKRVVKPTTRPHQAKPRSKPIETEANLDQKMVPISDCSNALSHSSEVERLWWRNQKPFRRVSKKRAELQTLSQFFRIQQQ